jgi:predicted DNA binding CopG/RHH family protein
METTKFIDMENPLKLADLDIELPDDEPTKVVSIRLPSKLLNQVKAYAGARDVNYSAVIKMILSEEMDSHYKSAK